VGPAAVEVARPQQQQVDRVHPARGPAGRRGTGGTPWRWAPSNGRTTSAKKPAAAMRSNRRSLTNRCSTHPAATSSGRGGRVVQVGWTVTTPSRVSAAASADLPAADGSTSTSAGGRTPPPGPDGGGACMRATVVRPPGAAYPGLSPRSPGGSVGRRCERT
jgi:hypothetical protein